MLEREREQEGEPSTSLRRSFLKRVLFFTASALGSPSSAADAAAAKDTGELALPDCSGLKIPMRDVAGKVAFITGGSSGIGLGVARAFLDAGMKVIIGYLTTSHLAEALKLLSGASDRVHAIRVDVTDRPGMIKAAAEAISVFGRVHVLVNNAGVVHPGPLAKTTHEDWDWVMNVNLNGVFNGVHAFLPHLLAHNAGGQIISTSSIDGLIADASHPSYTASKFGVVGLMEALRAELADSNVGVSVCCPAGVYSRIGASRRNHPGEKTHADDTKTAVRALSSQRGTDISKLVMDPLKAGQFVLRGMRNNDLYILTHPEFTDNLQDRTDAIVASSPKDLQPTTAQFEMARAWRQSSLYRKESRRILCTEGSRMR